MAYQYIFDAEACWYKSVCTYYKDEEVCRPTCPRYAEMHYLMATSNLPLKKQQPHKLIPEEADLPAFLALQGIKEDIMGFVDNGESLYIYGENYGNGKTTWAIKMLQSYFNKVWYGNAFRIRGLFISVPMFLAQLKRNIAENDPEFNKLCRNVLEVDLVVWDDIASTKLTEHDHSQLLAYIEGRLLNERANIYTGNLTSLEAVDNALGPRLASRVWNASTRIELKGTDWRTRNDFPASAE